MKPRSMERVAALVLAMSQASCVSIVHAQRIKYLALSESQAKIEPVEIKDSSCFWFSDPQRNAFEQLLEQHAGAGTLHDLSLIENNYWALNGWVQCFAVETRKGGQEQ